MELLIVTIVIVSLIYAVNEIHSDPFQKKLINKKRKIDTANQAREKRRKEQILNRFEEANKNQKIKDKEIFESEKETNAQKLWEKQCDERFERIKKEEELLSLDYEGYKLLSDEDKKEYNRLKEKQYFKAKKEAEDKLAKIIAENQRKESEWKKHKEAQKKEEFKANKKREEEFKKAEAERKEKFRKAEYEKQKQNNEKLHKTKIKSFKLNEKSFRCNGEKIDNKILEVMNRMIEKRLKAAGKIEADYFSNMISGLIKTQWGVEMTSYSVKSLQQYVETV